MTAIISTQAIGNHEFSHRVEGLVPFLRALRSPVVACNVDASGEPQLTGLFQPSIVIRRGPQKIGIVGVTLENMSVSGNGLDLCYR